MSGQKVTYARITTDEFERLKSAARVAENMESKIRSAVSSKEYELKNEFQSRLDSINRRNSEQSRLIDTMSDSMQNMEREFQREYQEQSNRHRRDFANLNDKLDVEVSHIHNRLDTQRKEYTTLIENQGKVLSGKINDLKHSIEQKETNKANQAKEWLNNAENALKMITTYNHQKFAPGEYEELKNRLQMSQANISNGIFESSISNSQTVWMDSYKLRAKLEQLENEWNAYYELAKQSNLELIATCEAHEFVKLAFEAEEVDETFEANINYWSNGKLDELKTKANEIKSKLSHKDDLSVESLKQLIQSSMEFKEEVLSLVDLSRDNIILHEKRIAMANEIANFLDDKNYEVVDECYDYDDKRDAYRVKFRNSNDEEMVTIITPQGNLQNKLDIHFFDKSVNESERKNRLGSMLKSLQESGIKCDTPQCIEGTQNEAYGDVKERDFETIKNKKNQTLKG